MSASTVMAVITGGIVGAIFVSSLFLQQVLGASPVIAGLEFLPLAASPASVSTELMARGIRRHVEHTDTRRAAHRRRDRRHHVGTPPFADVRNALDDRHGTS